MRTTLAIDDELLRRLKQRAAAQGTTLQALANDILRQGLARAQTRKPYHLKLRGWKGSVHAGIDLLDRNSLWQAMEEADGKTSNR